MTDSDAAPVPSGTGDRAPSRLISPDAQVWFIIVSMAVVLGVSLAIMPLGHDPLRQSDWWIVIPITLAFALSERAAFDVQVGDQGHSFSMSEMPTAFAMVYLGPIAAVLTRAIGTGPMLYGPRGNRGIKLAFNIILWATEVVLAMLVCRTIVMWWDDSNVAVLMATAVGLVLASVNSGVTVATVVSRYSGGFLERVQAEVVGIWWFYAMSGVFAVMGVGLAMHNAWLALALLPPTASLWFVLHRFGILVQEMRDLDALHGFAGRVGTTLDVDVIASRAVDDVVELIRADGAALLRVDGDSVVVTTSGHVPIRLPRRVDDPRWDFLVGLPDAGILDAAEVRTFGAVTDDHLKALMVAPVRDDGEVFAVLLATERNIQRMRFAEPELARMRNMADQLAVSLRRGVLHTRLEYEARHDALTDLPSRRLFEEAVAGALAAGGDGVRGVMMMDLDRFKEVNDTLGHHSGDQLLIEFSHRISTLLDPGDMLARLAGDEFAILCHRSSPDDVITVARACVELGGRPVNLDGLEIVVTVSVGVALLDPDEDDPLQPMRRADIAMYNAKWQRTGVEMYRDEIDRRTPARLSMLGDLRSAIDNDELMVMYQPKLDLSTGEVVGAEALVRWNSPTRGMVQPAEFVRVAEDTGLIKDLTDLVLQHGMAALRSFHDQGLDIRLAVNLSTHDLFDSRLPARVCTHLRTFGIEPEDVTLEITESSLLIDAPRTRATIDDLHDAGFRLAVDDFGTGYSSLSYLRRLPVQELKIDQSFVMGMLSESEDEVIVKSTIDLGHNLQLSVVAEGVEDDRTLDALAAMGCDIAQGYGIAIPLSAPDFVRWVQQHQAHEGSDTVWPARRDGVS